VSQKESETTSLPWGGVGGGGKNLKKKTGRREDLPFEVKLARRQKVVCFVKEVADRGANKDRARDVSRNF